MKYGTFLGSILIAASIVGCERGDKSATTRPSGALTIAVVPKGTTHDFWTAVHAGAEAAAKECGANIIWKGPTDEGRYADQISIVEDMITRNVDGIVLAPTHDRALRDVVVKAHDKGILVAIFDSEIVGADSAYVTFAATDNYKGGVLGAQRLAELLGGKGNVAMVKCQPGGASTEKRESGFRDTMAKEFPNINVVDEKWGYSLREKSASAAEDILTRHQGKLDGFFGSNESSAAGILLALRQRNLAGKIKFVGFDSSPDLIAGLKDGSIQGLVVQNPYKMGYEGVKSLVLAKAGKKVPKRIDTGVVVVTKENMSQPEIAKLINPPKVRSGQ